MPGIPNHSRPMVRVETLVLAVTAWIVATANGPWWAAVSQGRDWFRAGNWLFLACCFVMLVGLHFAVIAPLAFRRVVRPLLTLLVVLSAGAAWYMSSYAVMLDPTMIQNVLHTDAHEARELLDPHMVGSVLLWSALPDVLVGTSALWVARRVGDLSDRTLLVWNAVGMLALVLGAPFSAHALVPTFVAPMLLLLHLLSIAQVVRRGTPSFG